MELLKGPFKGRRLFHSSRMSGTKGLVIVLSLMIFPVPGLSQDKELEYRVKAAFIYNFTKFVDWPAPDIDPENDKLQVCVVGNALFNELLQQTFAGKTKNSLQLSSRLIAQPSEAKECGVLFLGEGDALYLRDWIQTFSGNPVLTVSEGDNFVDFGGMIQFVIVNGKIRFDINHAAVKESQLQISSRLLSLARQVKR